MAGEPSNGSKNRKRTNNGKRQHPLVDKLRPKPSDPPVIACRGYLGRSEREDHWRIYLTSALTDYFEIADEDIVLQEDNEKDPEAPSRIWIKEDARITRGPPREVSARDLLCAPLPRVQYGRPRIGLAGRLVLAPLLPLAIAANCWSALFDEIEDELFGEGCYIPSGADVVRRGNILNLRRSDYWVLR